MSHRYRFYAPSMPAVGGRHVLSRDETRHALKAVRMRDGDPVALFDGRGGEGVGRMEILSGKDAAVVVESARTAPPPMPSVTLVQAWLNRDAPIEHIIWRGTELGVGRFCFFRAAHSDRPPKRRDKWERWAIEACKQCGRAWLPTFAVAPSLEAALTDTAGPIAVAAQGPGAAPFGKDAVDAEAGGAFVVGPEGGLTEEELTACRRRGARFVSLGAHTLRAEAAAVLGASLMLYELRRFAPPRDGDLPQEGAKA